MSKELLDKLIKIHEPTKPFPDVGDFHSMNSIAFMPDEMKQAHEEKNKPELKRLRGDIGKPLGLALVYGGSEFTVKKQLNCSDTEAGNLISNFFKVLPTLKKWMKRSKRFAEENLFIKTFMGRRLYIDALEKSNPFKVRMVGYRKALNSPIQGAASELIKLLLLKTSEYIERNKMYKWQGNLICHTFAQRIVAINAEQASNAELIAVLEGARKGNVQVVISDGDTYIGEWHTPLKLNMETIEKFGMELVY